MANPPTTGAPGRERVRHLFLALEGGGAKGIAHVAALRAFEEALADAKDSSSRIQYGLTEVAGTSAGAIVAAFLAAGAKSYHLIDDDGRMPLASALGIESFRDLFGLAGWRRLKLWRRILKPSRLMQSVESRISGNSRNAYKQWKETNPEDRTKLAPELRRTVRKRCRRPFVASASFAALILLVLIVAALVGRCIEFLAQRSDVTPYAFLCFWFLARTYIAVGNAICSQLEKRKLRLKSRHMPLYIVWLTHPFFGMAISLASTYLIFESSFGSLSALITSGVRAHLSLFQIGFLNYLLYATCILLLIRTFVSYLREFLKGIVRTDHLARDLNTALVTLITQTPQLDQTRENYIWNDKIPDETHKELFARLKRPGYWATFKDLEDLTGVQLHIVAADTVATKVKVYSSTTHEHYSVANAVAASLAIPFIFRPVRDATQMLVDGGIVSSIPAWVFRRQRTHDPDARILAFGISPSVHEKWIPLFLRARRISVANYNRRRRTRRFGKVRYPKWLGKFRVVVAELA